MASPRQSRRSDAGRLIAASLAVASFDARAHGGAGFEWLVIPFFMLVGAVVVCFVIHMGMGGGDPLLRFFAALGYSLADIGLAFAGAWLLAYSYQKLAPPHADAALYLFAWGVGIIPWFLPAYLFVRARRR